MAEYHGLLIAEDISSVYREKVNHLIKCSAKTRFESYIFTKLALNKLFIKKYFGFTQNYVQHNNPLGILMFKVYVN